MSRKTAAEIAVLIGIFAFFLGGLLNFRKEITDILFSAVIVGVTVFFVAFFAITLVYREDIEAADRKEREQYGDSGMPYQKNVLPADKPTEKKKGTRLDITTGKDDLEDLFK
jgi:divalent metal cation (Fe/Co/Zn/Cd) transporter